MIFGCACSNAVKSEPAPAGSEASPASVPVSWALSSTKLPSSEAPVPEPGNKVRNNAAKYFRRLTHVSQRTVAVVA
jgi:hypothetical protein